MTYILNGYGEGEVVDIIAESIALDQISQVYVGGSRSLTAGPARDSEAVNPF